VFNKKAETVFDAIHKTVHHEEKKSKYLDWWMAQLRGLKASSKHPGMSVEDERILEQCSKDVFYKRSLPLAAAGAVAVRVLGGKRAPSQPRRIWPFALAIVAGLVAGPLMHAGSCAKKIADSSSHSEYARKIRELRKHDKIEHKHDKKSE
jgi:hypothetical protein